MRQKQAKNGVFQAAETDATLPDGAFREVKDRLRFDLVDLQQRCRTAAAFPIIIIVSGIQGAGGVDTLNLLNTWMDPRWIHTHAPDTPTDEERERPPLWRYWRRLPADGNIGLYLYGWYGDAVAARCGKHDTAVGYAARLDHIKAFKQTLAADGALIVKIWLHLSKAQHAHRADQHRADAVFGFRASDDGSPQPASYDAYTVAAGQALRATSTEAAPWHIVAGADDNYRRAQVLGILRDAMKSHSKLWRKKAKTAAKDIKRAVKAEKKHKPKKTKIRSALAKVDLSQTLTPAAYARAFRTRQSKLYDLQKAAGKGGAIRRLTYAMSARNYVVVPIAAPNDDERAHHYLWRFWRQISRAGHITLFDRTWYGRVLVERVEHLITEEAWTRAYDEINEFESQLIENDTIVLKFWLHVDADEHLRRFKEREDTPYKNWKITEDDWRNRAKRGAYEAAVSDMIARTSTRAAPWHLIAANDKRHAHNTIMDIVIAALETALHKRGKRRVSLP